MKKWRNISDKTQRLQLKALICVLGIGLILFLLLVQLWFLLTGERQPHSIEEIHIPVVEHLSNAWVIDCTESELLVFYEGQERSLPTSSAAEAPFKEQIADVVVRDGVVTEIQVKKDKINGTILSADEEGIVVEGYGKLEFTNDYKGYRIYNTLASCGIADIPYGYNYTDLVLEEGKVCGILLVKDAAMDHIRVLIKGSDYSSLLHEELVVTGDCDYTIQYGTSDNQIVEEYAAGQTVTITEDSTYLEGQRLVIKPKVLTGKILLQNVSRSQGTPAYRGQIEVLATEEGMAVINDVSLEEYLYSVVPSEMPASYHEEALKAQAVCARTYAYGHMLHAGYSQYGAHVDDSTSYQVYNNVAEQESTTKAVKATYGQLLYTPEDTLASTYYYSTSCGMGSDATVWKTAEATNLTYLKAKPINKNAVQAVMATLEEDMEALTENTGFAEYIQSVDKADYEVEESWYRWSVEVKELNADLMLERMQERYNTNQSLVLTLDNGEYVSKPVRELDNIQDIFVCHRGAGGVADELIIKTKKHVYMVVSEYNIRYVLNDGQSKVIRQDGSEVDMPTLLPSAFCTVECQTDKDGVTGYTITGGGYGHGVGMSQNGAKAMAKSGLTSSDILLFFYDGCSIRNIYEGQ